MEQEKRPSSIILTEAKILEAREVFALMHAISQVEN